MADVSGNAERGRPRNTYPDFIGEVLQKGRVRSTRDRRTCMNVDEAKGVCKDRSRWRSVLSAYPQREKGISLCMHVCMYYGNISAYWTWWTRLAHFEVLGGRSYIQQT